MTRTIARIDPATRQRAPRRRRRPAREDDHPRVRRRLAAALDRGLRPARRQGHLLRRGAQRGADTHGLDVHIIGAGNSAGQAAMFFSTHARSVTILCRGDALEKSMSRYLIDQLATRPNIEVLLPDAEVAAAHGDASLEAIDVRDCRDRRDDPAGVRRALHLHRRGRRDRLASAGDRARPKGLRPDRHRVPPRAAGSSTATRTCSRRASPGSSRAATSASARSSASPRPSARAAWRSPSCTSTCARPADDGRGDFAQAQGDCSYCGNSSRISYHDRLRADEDVRHGLERRLVGPASPYGIRILPS